MMARRSLDALFYNNRLEFSYLFLNKQKITEGSPIKQEGLTSFKKDGWNSLHFVLSETPEGLSVISESPASHLQLQHQVQSMLPQGVDGIDNQCYNNVDAVWLVLGYAGLKDSRTKTRRKKRICTRSNCELKVYEGKRASKKVKAFWLNFAYDIVRYSKTLKALILFRGCVQKDSQLPPHQILDQDL